MSNQEELIIQIKARLVYLNEQREWCMRDTSINSDDKMFQIDKDLKYLTTVLEALTAPNPPTVAVVPVEWVSVEEYLKDKEDPIEEYCHVLLKDETAIARLTFEHEFNLLVEFSHNGGLTTIGHDHILGIIPINMPPPHERGKQSE